MYVKKLPGIDKTQEKIDSFKWQFMARLYVYFGGEDAGFIRAHKFVMGEPPSSLVRNRVYNHPGFILTVRDTILEMEGKTLQEAADDAGLTLTFLLEQLKKFIKKNPSVANFKLGMEWLRMEFGEEGDNGKPLFGKEREALGDGKIETAVVVDETISGNGKSADGKNEDTS